MKKHVLEFESLVKAVLPILVFTFFTSQSAHAKGEGKTDIEVAELLIAESIAIYDGPCPCPYNIMANGNRCGGFSAYIKPKGESPLCYVSDVTKEMIAVYRAS